MDTDKNKKIQEQLKKLNELKPISNELLTYHKTVNDMVKKILLAIKEPKEILEIAKDTSIDSKKVLWILTGAVKYGKAEVLFPKTGYPQYVIKN